MNIPDGGEYISSTGMRLLSSMAGLPDGSRWIDIAPALSGRLRAAHDALRACRLVMAEKYNAHEIGLIDCALSNSELSRVNAIEREYTALLSKARDELRSERAALKKELAEMSEAINRSGYRAVRFGDELRIIPLTEGE